MATTLASDSLSPVHRQALWLLAEKEAVQPSPSSRSKHFRYLAILGCLKRGHYGNSAWGRKHNGIGLVQRRWKPWNKAKMDMTTFPFKLKPECRES